MTGQRGAKRDSKPPWSTCRWSGKRSWVTKADAKRAARGTGPGNLTAYRCEKCRYYHCGNSTAEWRARQREARAS